MKQKGKNSQELLEGNGVSCTALTEDPGLAQLAEGRQQLWDAMHTRFSRLTVPHPKPSRSSAGCCSRLTGGTQGQGRVPEGQCDHVTANGTSVTPLPALCLQSYCNILPLPMIASLVNLCLIKLSSLYQINKRNLLI